MNKDIDINSNKTNINEKENKDSSSPKDSITKNSIKDDLPPANGIQDYPNESQIEEKTPKINEVKLDRKKCEELDISFIK